MHQPLLLTTMLCAGVGAADLPVRPASADWPPVIGAWFWHDGDLAPEGYRRFLDAAAAHSPYSLLSTSLRVPQGEVTSPAVHDQVARAVRYAQERGLRIAFDLDVRLARRAFQERYPDEQQEELVLKLVELPAAGTVAVSFEGQDLGDHMTGGTIPYRCLATRLVRVVTFQRTAAGLDPNSLRALPADRVAAATDGPRRLQVNVPGEAGRWACVIAAHTYFTPDVFAPHLLSFQREIFRQYADLPLAGAMKDEWGFLPDHTGNPNHDRYWFSAPFAAAYAARSGGRDLVADTLLMTHGAVGRERERLAAINLYQRLCLERNAAIEDDFYRAAKETFGPTAAVVTHATWVPYPGPQEFRKNGLDWWHARRDLGQSDETTPYACRTSLAKRWGYPIWYNQYYSSNPADYVRELWAGALSGGRLNVHPIYPRKPEFQGDGRLALLQRGLTLGMSRVRMLDYLTRAPLDCPVAVVFGHAAATNWAGPAYTKVGLGVAGALAGEGYPADLLPSSLAANGALRLDDEGFVCLGPQRYRAVVLYRPEFGDAAELAFFRRAAAGRSALYQVGDWTCDEAARPLPEPALPADRVRRFEAGDDCARAVIEQLSQANVPRVTGWSVKVPAWGSEGNHATPPTAGHSALTDGTCLRIAGGQNPAGDPLRETFTWQGHEVTIDAVGLFAIRFAPDGTVAALAAGGLRSVKTAGLDLTLPTPVDLAWVREPDGRVHGVLQGWTGDVPAPLLAITADWERLAVPPLLPADR